MQKGAGDKATRSWVVGCICMASYFVTVKCLSLALHLFVLTAAAALHACDVGFCYSL